MQINFKIVYLKTKTLKFNPHNLKADGNPRDNKNYPEFRQTVKICGIQQPFKIQRDRTTLRSGNMRLAAALDENIEEVPCIIEEYNNEIDNTESHKEREQIIDDYKTVVHDIKKEETPYAKLQRLKALEAYHGIRQGVRSDKNPSAQKGKDERDKVATQTERTQLKTIEKNLEIAFPDDAAKQKEYWGGVKSLAAAVKETKMLAVKAQEPDNLNNRFDYITDQIRIYNQTCLDLAHIPDKSIQVVVCSPPYYKMRPAQEGFENELGQEETVDLFVENLVAHFVPCKVKLTKDGSIWVNLADNVKNGSYTLATEKFIIKMQEAGFYLNDLIYWVKINSQPSPDTRTTRNVEYLMQFKPSLKQNPYSDFTWLNDIQGFEDNVFGAGHGIKLTSFIRLKEGIVTTSTANTSRLREACEKAGFYLEHSSTFPPEIPFLCIKNSCKKGSHIIDLFNGCGNTAKAALYADMDLIYHGFEINPVSVRASKINIELDFGKQPKDNTIPFNPNQDNSIQQAI